MSFLTHKKNCKIANFFEVFFSNSLLSTSFLFLKDEVVIGGIYWNVGYVDQKLDMSLIHHNMIFIKVNIYALGKPAMMAHSR